MKKYMIALLLKMVKHGPAGKLTKEEMARAFSGVEHSLLLSAIRALIATQREVVISRAVAALATMEQDKALGAIEILDNLDQEICARTEQGRNSIKKDLDKSAN